MEKFILKLSLSLVCSLSLHAGTYDYSYSPLADTNSMQKVKKDPFLYGNFKKIVRFDMISFTDGEMKFQDKKIQNIVNTIKQTRKAGDEVRVTIIGHTDEPTDDYNEKAVDSDTYANKIQNLFRYSLDKNESKDSSKKYALDVQQDLLENGVDKNITIVEYRGGKDMAFTDGTTKGRDLSNRVMVTMYVLKPKDKDSDGDGILDGLDKCPNTAKGIKVNKNGCPLDSDKDGVLDYQDSCPNTPKGVSVDSKGCPLDSDKDGVPDYKDYCPETPLGFKVKINGCPISKNLALNFASSSAKIFKESYPKVVEFAKFLKQYPMYKVAIVGHTDSQGKVTSNMTLSQARALSVKNALIGEGIDAQRITSSGRGEFEPIASNKTKEGRRKNRRIEVKLSY